MKLTPPETILYLGVTVLAGSLLLGPLFAALSWKFRRDVRSDFRSMEVAVYDYRQKMKRMPFSESARADARFGTAARPNQRLTRALLGEPGQGGDLNPQNVRFLRAGMAGFRKGGLRPDGNWVDPWGEPYQVVFDMNGDNVCDLPGTGKESAVGVPVAIWSNGPDRTADTPDDIHSWE